MKDRTWNKLMEFETRDLIERYIKSKHKGTASARQILEISSNFIQGREYFINSKKANISVKPLLQYYGVLALSRGLILATNPKISEASLKPSHGLSIDNWQESLSKKEFENLTVKVKKGTFYELLTTTSNRAYFKKNSSGVNWKVDFDIPKIGTEIKFSDLIQTFSDFEEVYETWTEKDLDFLILESYTTLSDTNEHQFGIRETKTSNNKIEKVFQKNIIGNYQISKDKKTITTSNKLLPQFSQHFFDPFNTGIGEIAITKFINKNIEVGTLGQFYLLSYFMGMLSRYFPTVWISLGRTEKGDAIYPLFINAIELIENHFPKIILEFLESPYDFEKKNSN